MNTTETNNVSKQAQIAKEESQKASEQLAPLVKESEKVVVVEPKRGT